MNERQSNGQFAKKPRGRPFKPGNPKPKGSGRAPGTPNKVTRAVKDFLAALVDDGEVQDAVRKKIVRGDAVAFFRALEHVMGKPKETVEATHEVKVQVFRWKGDGD